MHSLTFAFATLAIMTVQFASGAPAAHNQENTSEMTQVANAYSGVAGDAAGGDVSNSQPQLSALLLPQLLKLFSSNGGHGGEANSGSALVARHERGHGHKQEGRPQNSNDLFGNAFTGGAGHAHGGSVNGSPPAVIDAFSDNGGDGGGASSGSAVSGPLGLKGLELGNLFGGS